MASQTLMGMRDISKIVIHCSASSDSLDIGAKEITEWHKERGWRTIGYHYVIRRNGKIEVGRPESEIGAHVKGHNKGSLGICWVGTNEISERQQLSLLTKIKELRAKYQIPLEMVLGHYELYSGKTCPNLDMDHVRAELMFTKKEKDEENTRLPKQEHGGLQKDESSGDLLGMLYNVIKHWFGAGRGLD